MKASQLLSEVVTFYDDLSEHKSLYLSSLGSPLPKYPVTNHVELQKQSEHLSRTLGRLRPFLLRFNRSWQLVNPATGQPWDALHESVSMRAVCQIKGESMRVVLDLLNQVIGRIESIEPDFEVPEDMSAPISKSGPVGSAIAAYSVHLHKAVLESSVPLFVDGHYPQAIETSVKAVFEHLRQTTGETGDGASLADKVFSEQKPVLQFSNLSNQSERNEHIGFKEQLKAFLKGVRHPRSHGISDDNDAQIAFEYMVTASLFCRRIDEAKSFKMGMNR